MKKTMLTTISSLLLVTSISFAVTSKKMPDTTKELFYKNFFSNIDTDMFINNENGITVNGKQIGDFRSGTSGITVYLSLFDHFKNATLVKEEYDIEVISKYSGIQPYQKGHENDRWDLFKFYNPDLIKWGIDNLYISPDTKIYDLTAQDIYNKSFQRYFRLTAETYLYLNSKKGMYKSEQNKYMDAYNKGIKSEDAYFDGIGYLTKKYDKVFKEYNKEEFSYSPGIATGFWLRRGIDKTDKVLWDGLKKIMTNYDKEWFKKVNK
ncbi:MAG: hypothetical protein ACK4IX_02845 [Candidatus Sericytochromatia bacterium]